MLSPTASRNTLQLPEQTIQFIEHQLFGFQTRLNQQSLIIRKKIDDLTAQIAETQTQMHQSTKMLSTYFSALQNTNDLILHSQQKYKERITSIEKKTYQVQHWVEDDLHFSQDVLAYESQLAAKMETLDTFTQAQANSLRKKIQKLDFFLTPIKKSLDDSEKSIAENNSLFTQKLSEFSINFTQESESLKTKALKLRESLQHLSDKKINQQELTQKEQPPKSTTPKPPKGSKLTKQSEEVLDELLDCKIDLSKAEAQFLSLFENAFKNQNMTATQKIALKASQELLSAANHLPSKTRSVEESLYARKVLTNQEMNQELLEIAVVDVLTNDASEYHFVECSGLNRQATDKPHEKLLIEIQKAIIRSFLDEYSDLTTQKALNPSFLDDPQYSLNFKSYLRKSNQAGNMILIVNKKTQVGIPLKMDK